MSVKDMLVYTIDTFIMNTLMTSLWPNKHFLVTRLHIEATSQLLNVLQYKHEMQWQLRAMLTSVQTYCS